VSILLKLSPADSVLLRSPGRLLLAFLSAFRHFARHRTKVPTATNVPHAHEKPADVQKQSTHKQPDSPTIDDSGRGSTMEPDSSAATIASRFGIPSWDHFPMAQLFSGVFAPVEAPRTQFDVEHSFDEHKSASLGPISKPHVTYGLNPNRPLLTSELIAAWHHLHTVMPLTQGNLEIEDCQPWIESRPADVQADGESQLAKDVLEAILFTLWHEALMLVELTLLTNVFTSPSMLSQRSRRNDQHEIEDLHVADIWLSPSRALTLLRSRRGGTMPNELQRRIALTGLKTNLRRDSATDIDLAETICKIQRTKGLYARQRDRLPTITGLISLAFSRWRELYAAIATFGQAGSSKATKPLVEGIVWTELLFQSVPDVEIDRSASIDAISLTGLVLGLLNTALKQSAVRQLVAHFESLSTDEAAKSRLDPSARDLFRRAKFDGRPALKPIKRGKANASEELVDLSNDEGPSIFEGLHVNAKDEHELAENELVLFDGQQESADSVRRVAPEHASNLPDGSVGFAPAVLKSVFRPIQRETGPSSPQHRSLRFQPPAFKRSGTQKWQLRRLNNADICQIAAWVAQLNQLRMNAWLGHLWWN
jgi:hypothetical protein